MINMAEKKESKTRKAVTKTALQKPSKPVEQQFFAEELASRMGIDSFEFLLIKREAGLKNKSTITMSEMQELYNKVVRR